MFVQLMIMDIGGSIQWVIDHSSGILVLSFVLVFLYVFLALGLGWPLPFENRHDGEDGDTG
jgi:hypothetical protein